MKILASRTKQRTGKTMMTYIRCVKLTKGLAELGGTDEIYLNGNLTQIKLEADKPLMSKMFTELCSKYQISITKGASYN